MQPERIAVLGAGESGLGAALLGRALGMEVLVSDAGRIKSETKTELLERGIQFEEGGHTLSRVIEYPWVIKSPGIPEKAEVVQALRKAGVLLMGEIEFASRFTQGQILAITGSNGKTTTTLLLHHMLRKAGLDAALGGNVGTSMGRLRSERDYPYWVLEVSSFQLDDALLFRPNIAVLTNITPDHLDRYNYQFERYQASKMRIALNQTPDDVFIFCLDDPGTQEALTIHPVRSRQQGFSLFEQPDAQAFGQGPIQIKTENSDPMNLFELALQGKHNAYNSMAAALAARALGVRDETIRASLADFENIEHRLESVLQIGGVSFINDSKATNVNSTWYALDSMTQPTLWIAGGVDKGNDYDPLLPLVKEKVKALICLGVDNQKLIDTFKDCCEFIVETTSMEAAVRAAYGLAKKGDAVLLSPACASFDLFENYEDRGQQFKEQVRKI